MPAHGVRRLVGTGTVQFCLPTGQTFVQDLMVPIPPMVTTGEYTLCVAATLGTATDGACATFILDAAGNVVGFSPDGTLPVTDTTWGAIKTTFQ